MAELTGAANLPPVQNRQMATDLDAVVAALAELDDGQLATLIESTHSVPQVAPGLLAWIESACDWELSRRLGLDYPLLPTEAAIPPEEDSMSINAAMVLWATFAQDERVDGSASVVIFDALVGLLTGGRHRH